MCITSKCIHNVCIYVNCSLYLDFGDETLIKNVITKQNSETKAPESHINLKPKCINFSLFRIQNISTAFDARNTI